MTNSIIRDIENMISDIPADIPRPLLSEALRPILELLSTLDLPTQTALLHHGIKDYFELTNNDIKAYEHLIKTLIPKNEKIISDKIETRNIVPDLLAWVKDGPEDKTKFLINEKGIMTIKDSVVFNGINCQPKPETDEFVPGAVYSEDIINKQIVYDPIKLLADVEAFIKAHVELPEDKNYLIPALWVLHTYLVIERQKTSPIMVFHGLKESGKSRGAEVLGALAFRGFLCTALNETNMWHIPKAFDATLLIEELKLHGKTPKEDLESVMKTRYKKGVKVARQDMESKGNALDRLKCYSTFGATVIATTEKLGEFIDNRSIEFMMSKNERKEVEDDVNLLAASELRDRLLYFRQHWLNNDFPTFESVARQRKGEKFNPLYQMLAMCQPTQEQITEFMTFMNDTETEKKDIEKESRQAGIFEIILTLTDTPWKDFTFKAIDLLDKLNIGKVKDGPHWSSRRWLYEQLRLLHIKEDSTTTRMRKVTFKNTKTLCDRFGITVPKEPIIGTDVPF